MVGNTDNNDTWLTPPPIIQALGAFDLDPCSPIGRPWDTAKHHLTVRDDGLSKPWFGRVWMNPPYGRELIHWLLKISQHQNGTALIFARTETVAFQDYVFGTANSILYIKGRLKFVRQGVIMEITVRNIDERFPDYKNVIPLKFSRSFKAKTKDFLKAVKKAKITANKTTYQVQLTFGGGQCKLHSEDLDWSNESDTFVKGEIHGDMVDFRIGINGQFGEEIMNTIDTEEVTIKMNKANEALIINDENLLMPVMLSNV